MYIYKLLIFLFILSFNSPVFAAGQSYDAGIRYLHVQKGQTLHNIVKRLYPERVKDWSKLSSDIVRQNPHAFINNDPTRMKADVRLKLPQRSVVRSVPATPNKAKKVGVVAEISGRVVAVNKSKISRKLYKGNAVYIGDKVITGDNGSVRLHMIDEAILDLRCFSIMVIEDYAINAANRRSILNLLQGSLRKVTGKIGKMSEDVYELKTPLASVGVRGTEYALRVFQSKGCGGTVDADDGLYLEVIKGLVDVHNESGKTVVSKGEAVYVALPETAPGKVKIKPGVLEPQTVTKSASVSDEDESSSSLWWWLLGAVAIALLL